MADYKTQPQVEAVGGFTRLTPDGLEHVIDLRIRVVLPQDGSSVTEVIVEHPIPIRQWLNECCVMGEGEEAYSQELYDSYRRFCMEKGYVAMYPRSENHFASWLAQNTRTTVVRDRRHGISLNDNGEDLLWTGPLVIPTSEGN